MFEIYLKKTLKPNIYGTKTSALTGISDNLKLKAGILK